MNLFLNVLFSTFLIATFSFFGLKGATPGYVLSLLSPLIILVFSKKSKKYFVLLISIIVVYVVYYLMQHISFLFSEIRSSSALMFLDPNYEPGNLFTKSYLSHSIYWLACILFFLATVFYYEHKFLTYVVLGIRFILVYGFIQFVYFVVANDWFDPLSNRTVGEGKLLVFHQTAHLMGMSWNRFISLLPEPSMYAFCMIPFIPLLRHEGYRGTHFFLLVSLILSTSSTFFLVLPILILYELRNTIFLNKINPKTILFILAFFLFSLIILPSLITKLLDKLSGLDFSGASRSEAVSNGIDYWLELPMFNRVFGLGHATVRQFDGLSTILINFGLFGFIVITAIFFYPRWFLSKEKRYLNESLLYIYITFMVAVPDMYFLSMWFVLGLAYQNVKFNKV